MPGPPGIAVPRARPSQRLNASFGCLEARYHAVSHRQYLFRKEIMTFPPGGTREAKVLATCGKSEVQFSAPRLE